jgi:type VI secretion system protein ImpH
MPGKKRRIHTSLIEHLRDEPYRFEFFQAVRLLLAQQRTASTKQDADILGQVIQFRNSTSLSFPPSEIESIEFELEVDQDFLSERSDSGNETNASAGFRKIMLTPSFIGLTGPMGVMPRHYTHYVAEREIYHRDTATRAFLDIFTTRAVALFYQTWLKYRLHLQYEVDRKNRFLPLILSLSGLGLPGMRQRLAGGAKGIADESLAYYSGALRERPQSVQWFSRVATDYFSVACKVEQFVGEWFQLPDTELTRIGVANCGLGQTSFCGSRVWGRQTKVRLMIGPMRKKQFDEFLPHGASANNLRHLFQLMVGNTFDCEVKLILDKRDVAPASLNTRSGNTRLGWSGWLKSSEIHCDSSDTAYLINAASNT